MYIYIYIYRFFLWQSVCTKQRKITTKIAPFLSKNVLCFLNWRKCDFQHSSGGVRVKFSTIFLRHIASGWRWGGVGWGRRTPALCAVFSRRLYGSLPLVHYFGGGRALYSCRPYRVSRGTGRPLPRDFSVGLLLLFWDSRTAAGSGEPPRLPACVKTEKLRQNKDDNKYTMCDAKTIAGIKGETKTKKKKTKQWKKTVFQIRVRFMRI